MLTEAYSRPREGPLQEAWNVLVLLGRARARAGWQRRQKSRGGFKTRKDAERAFAELRDEVRRGAYVEPSKLSLNRYLEEEWLPSIEASVRPTTLRNYRDLYEAYVKPTLGRTQLVNITPAA